MSPAPRISVVDCGLGNVASVANILRKAGAEPVLTGDPDQLSAGAAVVLPGVGAFDTGVARLRSTGMWDALLAFAATGRPMLGVCIGMQLLARGSDEGVSDGMGLVDARFVRFSSERLKVPHTGWNAVRPVGPSVLFDDDPQEELRFYFVHAYYAVPGPGARTIATAYYGDEFSCAYVQDNVMGVQFHPEKSHRFGLALMRRFVEANA